MSETLRAIVIEDADGKHKGSLKEITTDDLPEGEVTVNVAYSTLNYKDGLAVTGTAKIARKPPLIGGIDLAGTVETSSSPDYKPGDKVLVNGWGLSESHNGGYTQKQRLKADWLVPVPEKFSLKQAMAIGTAGYTSMLCVMDIERLGVKPGDKEVLVTGAAGGVGSVAVALLDKLGYKVAASTGRAELSDYLKSLGASTIIERAELAEPSKRPMDAERWSGAIDSVGGETLASALRHVLWRSRCCVWFSWRWASADDGVSVYSAWGEPGRR